MDGLPVVSEEFMQEEAHTLSVTTTVLLALVVQVLSYHFRVSRETAQDSTQGQDGHSSYRQSTPWT